MSIMRRTVVSHGGQTERALIAEGAEFAIAPDAVRFPARTVLISDSTEILAMRESSGLRRIHREMPTDCNLPRDSVP